MEWKKIIIINMIMENWMRKQWWSWLILIVIIIIGEGEEEEDVVGVEAEVALIHFLA